MNRLLIILGACLIALGIGWPWLGRIPLFHLPGDVIIDRPGLRFYFPITTMLVISAAVSLIAWLARR
jgi:hypothetical protein